MKHIKNIKQNHSKTQNEIDENRIFAYTIEEQEVQRYAAILATNRRP